MPEHRRGSQACECGACGQWFGGLTGFDMHRVGDYDNRRCLTPKEIVARGYVIRDGMWRKPPPASKVWGNKAVELAGSAQDK
jgi:hypothetical protein